jgi:hypothetical protein
MPEWGLYHESRHLISFFEQDESLITKTCNLYVYSSIVIDAYSSNPAYTIFPLVEQPQCTTDTSSTNIPLLDRCVWQNQHQITASAAEHRILNGLRLHPRTVHSMSMLESIALSVKWLIFNNRCKSSPVSRTQGYLDVHRTIIDLK